MGAVSAADDVSMDAVDASVDDAVIADTVIDDTEDSTAVEETPVDIVSDDTTTEEINEGIQTDEINEESADVDSEPMRSNDAYAANWSALKGYGANEDIDYTIYLTNPITVDNSVLTFGNSATIIGTPTNYITGGSSSKIHFQSTGDLEITFINVTFKDMSASVLMKLSTSGINKFINCSFDNIHTYAFQSSVIWNNGGWMTISGCNFTNCNNSFGVITNHKTYDTVFMDVENCRFENNTGRYEPGAINNCGVLNVTDSTFINNKAGQWAGAIHTHSNAYSRIVGSNFTNNVAGTNGGALFSYSKLEVIDCNFDGNNASTNGGAICGYSYGSIYNITVKDSRFTNNRVSSGPGGAIRAMNLGYLNVSYSNFTNNHASNGQAISGITETITYCNCVNCTCPNCPNCENCTHYISNESANLKLYNNIYLNHTETSDTVTISGNEYIFNNNVFINSTQNTVYNGTGNKYNLTDYPNPIFGQTLSKPILGSFALGDSDHAVIYVNSSKEEAGDGSSWAEAYNDMYSAITDISDNGIIYLAPSSEKYSGSISDEKNITIIGFDKSNTIVSMGYVGTIADNSGIHYKRTYINLTIKHPRNKIIRIEQDTEFINCSFESKISTTSEIYAGSRDSPSNYDAYVDSFVITFTGCEFKDFELDDALINAYRYSKITFNNCTFENINANSIVKNAYDDDFGRASGFIYQDSYNFYGCIFNNVNVKGIVDVPTGTEPIVRYVIESCTGVENFGPITEDGRDYVNLTASKTATVLTASVDADENLVISLKDDQEAGIAGAQVLISVNEGEAVPFELESDGRLTKPLSDFGLTGPVSITVTFAETNDYKGATQTVEYVIRNATSISAEDLSTEVNVAKDLTVTLLDNNGNPIGEKEIVVSVGGVNSTVNTDSNGVATIPISYDTPGVYEYTLYFAGDETTYKDSTKVVKVTVTKVAEPVKAATKLTAAKVTATYNVAKKLVITLTDANGKALSGKKVTVKVGTISKTLKTNAKGQVSLNVATLVPKTYTATIKFAGDSAYTASTVKPKVVVNKAKVKIAAKAKTFKVKAKTKKVTATLKNNKGKVMKKVKLTLKIGKKTYTAKTNAKGVATFKVKLTKKGKYTGTVKFAGNKYFKALSKKVKITVKK